MSNASDFVIENGVLKKYYGKAGDILIPEGIKKIDAFAFSRYNRSGGKILTSITFPKSLTSLDPNWASLGFENITRIHVVDDNKKFCSEDGVLFNKNKTKLLLCPDTKTGVYKVPESVTSIERKAFAFCSQITSIYISAGVLAIGESALLRCGASAFHVEAENPNFCSVDGVLFNKDKTKLIQYPAGREGEYIIPTGVLSVGEWAFCGSNITEIVVPHGVKTIGRCAFCDCQKLTGVTLPGSIEKISYGATGEMQDSSFAYSRAIKNIVFDTPECSKEMIKMLKSNDLFGIIEPDVLQAPMIPLEQIYSKYKKAAAFGFIDAVNNNFLANPELVKSYHKYLSAQKKKLYPEILQKQDRTRYFLDHAIIPLSDVQLCLEMAEGKIETRTMIMEYQQKAFSEKDKAKQLKKETAIPTETSLQKAAFTTKKLKNSTLCITKYKGNNTEIIIPDVIGKTSVSAIGEEAFSASGKHWRDAEYIRICTNLTCVTLGSNIKEIGYGAFKGCKNLERIYIPKNVNQINPCAFLMCENLTIHAPAGSYAEQYAKENNIPFVAE